MMRDLDQAIVDFDRVIEIKPRWAWAHNNRGAVWYANGLRKIAEDEYFGEVA